MLYFTPAKVACPELKATGFVVADKVPAAGVAQVESVKAASVTEVAKAGLVTVPDGSALTTSGCVANATPAVAVTEG